MKHSSTFLKKRNDLLYGLVAAIKEIYYAITTITGEDNIIISNYANYRGVGKEVKSYANVLSPYSAGNLETGTITTVYRQSESVRFKAQGISSERDDGIYDFSVDEILAVYEQLEAIYKFEKANHQKESLA